MAGAAHIRFLGCSVPPSSYRARTEIKKRLVRCCLSLVISLSLAHSPAHVGVVNVRAVKVFEEESDGAERDDRAARRREGTIRKGQESERKKGETG